MGTAIIRMKAEVSAAEKVPECATMQYTLTTRTLEVYFDALSFHDFDFGNRAVQAHVQAMM
jgi:hypothetical protein